MWEEMNKKQNEDDMIQLLFYSRVLYNRSTRIAAIKICIVIISIFLVLIQKDSIYVSALFTVLFSILELSEHLCVKYAAKARNLFDSKLFDFEKDDDCEAIEEKAYRLCKKHKKSFQTQKENLGTDNPPGLRNWYSENDGKNKDEIIFYCQKENTKWDMKITFINLIIYSVVLFTVIAFGIYKYYNENLSKFISIIVAGFGLVCEEVKRIILYFKYNNNITLRNYLIKDYSESEISHEQLVKLQNLIKKRREMDLVPLNFIHKIVTEDMHDVIKKMNKKIKSS